MLNDRRVAHGLQWQGSAGPGQEAAARRTPRARSKTPRHVARRCPKEHSNMFDSQDVICTPCGKFRSHPCKHECTPPAPSLLPEASWHRCEIRLD
jgi:hypothetical protein